MGQAEDLSNIQITGRWEDNDALPIVLADHLIVSARGDYYLLTVGQTRERMLPTDKAGLDEFLADPAFPIRPVARLVVPRTKMAEWVRVLNGLWEKMEGPTPGRLEQDE